MVTIGRIRNSFAARCIVFCILIFVAPTMVLFNALQREAQTLSRQEAANFLLTNLKNVAANYDELMRNANLYHLQPLNNKEFQAANNRLMDLGSAITYESLECQAKIGEIITDYLMTNTQIDSIYMYNSGASLFYNYSLYYKKKLFSDAQLSEEEARQILDFLGSRGRNAFAIRKELEGDKPVFTSASRTNMFMPMDAPIYLAINLDARVLAKRLVSSTPGMSAEFYVADRFGGALKIDAQGMRFLEADEEPLPALSEGDYVLSGDGASIFCRYRAPYAGFSYWVKADMSSFDSMPSMIERFIRHFMVTICCILMVILAVSALYILRPIKKVYAAMRRVEAGDMHTRIAVTRSDELGYIQLHFNQMLDSIERLIATNYETVLSKREMELKYFHTQINEHFLYNTLDNVHWIAQKMKVPQISAMIMKLSNFYRMTLSEGDELVPVSRIVRILETYVELMNLRLNGAIQLRCRVEPDVLDIRVLKYVFQPIIENAIAHGIAKKGSPGAVDVVFETYRGDYLRFMITDDGAGIEPELLRRIRASLNSDEVPKGEFFALKNILDQLRLYYGAGGSVTIDSAVGRGTCVAVLIPLEGEGADDVQDVDRG